MFIIRNTICTCTNGIPDDDDDEDGGGFYYIIWLCYEYCYYLQSLHCSLRMDSRCHDFSSIDNKVLYTIRHRFL